MKTCEYEQVECPNKCESVTGLLLRVDLGQHLLECPLRIAKCEHCRSDVVATQLARHHLLSCPKFPVACPACGDVQISRENVNSHVNIITGTCSMTIVPCSFRHIGCLHQDQRARMHKHYTEANTQHLMMLSTKLVDMETKHRLDLEQYTARVNTCMAEMHGRLDEQSRSNRNMTREIEEYQRLYGPLRTSSRHSEEKSAESCSTTSGVSHTSSGEQRF